MSAIFHIFSANKFKCIIFSYVPLSQDAYPVLSKQVYIRIFVAPKIFFFLFYFRHHHSSFSCGNISFLTIALAVLCFHIIFSQHQVYLSLSSLLLFFLSSTYHTVMFLCFLYNAFSFHTFHFFFTFPYFIIFLLDMLESSLSLPYSLHLFHSYIYIPLLFLDFSSVHPLSLPLLSNLCFTSFSPLSYHLYHSVSVPQSSSLTFSSTSLLLLVSPSLCPSHYHSHRKGFTSYYIIIRTSFTIDRLCCGLRESTLFIHEVEKKSTFRKSIFTIFFYQYFFLYFI